MGYLTTFYPREKTAARPQRAWSLVFPVPLNHHSMHARQIIAFLGLTGLCHAPAAGEEECNSWPWAVQQAAPDKPPGGREQAWQAAGPLFFRQTSADGSSSGGFRPFFVYGNDVAGRTAESDFLYPLLSRREDATGVRWSLFEMVNSQQPKPSAPPGERERRLDVWPFYFSRDTGDPSTSYHALFPIQGAVIDRLGFDSISWTLFPFYSRFEKKGVTTTATPWPIIKVFRGGENHGFALWPLVGWRAKDGDHRERFCLWPLVYKNESKLSQPRPEVNLGVLPFYARDESADALSETYVWPFFGYTRRTAPYRYDETRLLWPIFVQGRGDDRRINRWAPFYTHSNIKGDDKEWVLWPLVRCERWTDAGIAQNKTQFLYFLYWSLRERSAANPALPAAEKKHLWPFFSYWDDGARRRQFQLLSPLEVFFQHNEPVRRAYSPLFAVYRYERSAPDDTRASLLWNAVSWRRSPLRREFHLGPLFSTDTGAGSGRIALVNGLVGIRRDAAKGRWRLFLFDFFPKPDKKAAMGVSP